VTRIAFLAHVVSIQEDCKAMRVFVKEKKIDWSSLYYCCVSRKTKLHNCHVVIK
jgi:hypothetical protein